MRVFVCVLLWCLLHSLLHGHLCNFLHNKKVKNEGKKRSWCFIEEKIKKTTLKHPPIFPFSSFFPHAFIFLNSNFKNEQFKHSNYSWKSSNNKHVKVNDVASNIFSYLLLIFLSNFIIKYARLSIIWKVLPKEVTKF